MSQQNGNDARPSLRVLEGLAPRGEGLRPGYAYLIRSAVRMPELYPLLGELLFASEVMECGSQGGKGNSSNQRDSTPSGPNVIGLFIEDTPDNLMLHLDDPDRYQDGPNSSQEEPERSFTERFGRYLASPSGPGYRAAAWLDTYGQFHDSSGKLSEIELSDKGNKCLWWSQSIPGAGNPMAIMRFFRLAQEKEGTAAVNIFLLNSLSNLYKNLGLSESAAFLKTMLNESIWSVNPDRRSQKIRDNYGIFFAVLQEDVLKQEEASYLESFFDGIIEVKPTTLADLRVAHLRVQTLPEIVIETRDLLYLPSWQFKRNEGLSEDGWTNRTYIHTSPAYGIIERESRSDAQE